MAKPMWQKWLMVGVGLWVVGFGWGMLSAPLILAVPILSIPLVIASWFAFGYVAYWLVNKVK